MLGDMVISLLTLFFQMNAKILTPTVKTRMTGDSTPGTNSKNLPRTKLPLRTKKSLRIIVSAAGKIALVNSKLAMKTDTFMVTILAGLNTVGTNVTGTNAKNGTPKIEMRMVTGCGSPTTAHKVVLRMPNPRVLPTILLLHLRHGALTANAMKASKLIPSPLKRKTTGSTTSGMHTKMVSRTRAT